MFVKNKVDTIDFEQLEKDLVKETKKNLLQSILKDAERECYVEHFLVGRGAE